MPKRAQSTHKIIAILLSYVFPFIIGITVSVATGLFDHIVAVVSQVWHTNLLSSALDIPKPWLRAALPILAIPLIVYVLNKIPGKRQHSQAEIIESIHINHGKLDIKSAWYSILGALISLSSGYSVGQYGPTVQQGSAVGFTLSKVKLFEHKQFHIFIASGVAAAIAAIFHSPIGAVVFAHEVILRFFSTRAFAPITISAVTSYVVSSEVFHRTTFLSSTQQIIASPTVYALVAILAVAAGILGMLFIRFIMTIQLLTRRRKVAVHYRVITAALIMALFAYYLPDVMGTSSYFLHAVVNGYELTIGLIALILIAKFFATAFSIGLGIPGGVFSPAIFIGALLGALAYQSLNFYFPSIEVQGGLLVITTMAAMASAVMGAPVSMILIILEITDNFTLTSAVMVSVVIANLTAYRLLGANSFFDAQLKARGINMEVGRDLLYLKQRNIFHIISENYVNLNAQTTLEEAEKQLLEKRQASAYISNEELTYEGHITLVNIRDALRDDKNAGRPVVDFANKEGAELYRLSTIWEAIELMGNFDGTHVPVIESPENPTLIGVIYESTLIKEYLDDMQHIRAREHN